MSVAQVWAKGGVWSAIQKWGRVFREGLRSRSLRSAPGTPRKRDPPGPPLRLSLGTPRLTQSLCSCGSSLTHKHLCCALRWGVGVFEWIGVA